MRNFFKLFIALCILSVLFHSCTDDNDTEYKGNWVEMEAFLWPNRSHAVTFTINNKVYIGTGYDYDEHVVFKDFWELTIDGNSFQLTQIDDFPGVGRNRSVAFATETSGYVGLGKDINNALLGDFYKYTPGIGWEELTAAFPGTARKDAVAFFVDGKGYVGTGEDEDGCRNDFFSLDPSTDKWESISPVPLKRSMAMTFTLDGNAYLISGYYNKTQDDFYRYDTLNDEWVELNHISDYTGSSFDDSYDNDIERYGGVAFTMGGKAYLATGNGSTKVWEWNPITDYWKRKNDFEGPSRYGAVSFTINDIGYIATGGNGSYSFNDIWYFDPEAENNIND